jgi:hypothetical protein
VSSWGPNQRGGPTALPGLSPPHSANTEGPWPARFLVQSFIHPLQASLPFSKLTFEETEAPEGQEATPESTMHCENFIVPGLRLELGTCSEGEHVSLL